MEYFTFVERSQPAVFAAFPERTRNRVPHARAGVHDRRTAESDLVEGDEEAPAVEFARDAVEVAPQSHCAQHAVHARRTPHHVLPLCK